MESDSEGSQYCLVKKGSHKGREVAVGTTDSNPKLSKQQVLEPETTTEIINARGDTTNADVESSLEPSKQPLIQNVPNPIFNLIEPANEEPLKNLPKCAVYKDLKKDTKRLVHQQTLERKSSLSPTQALYLNDNNNVKAEIKRGRMVRGRSIAVPLSSNTPLQNQVASKDDFKVSYTSLRSEDISLVPDDHVKEQRKLEKMFREIQRKVHSPENSCSSGFLSPNNEPLHDLIRPASKPYNNENSSSIVKSDSIKKTGSGHSIYYALPIRNDGCGRNRSVSISPMLYTTDVTSYWEGRNLSGVRRASFASPTRGGRSSIDSRICSSRRSSNSTSIHEHYLHSSHRRPRLSQIGKSVSLNPRYSDVDSFDPLLNASRVGSIYLDNSVDILSNTGIQSSLPRPNSLPLECTSELRLKMQSSHEEKKRQRASIIVSSGALTFILLAASLVTMSFLMSPVIERVFVQDKLNNTHTDYNFSDYDYMNYTGMKLHNSYPINLEVETRSNGTSRESGHLDSG